MQLMYDAKIFRKLFVVNLQNSHGLGFSFYIFNYRNIIGLSSLVDKNKHVIFGDFEKRLTKKRMDRIKSVMIANNIALLCFFKSSKEKYHFISPQVYDWLDAIRISTELGAEKNYLSISSVRQEFILRISRKGNKGEPKPYKIITNPYAKDVVFSNPHCHFLKVFYNLNDNFLKQKMLGKDMTCERYRTTNL